MDTLLAISARYGDDEGRQWAARAMQEPDRVLLRLVPETLLTWDIEGFERFLEDEPAVKAPEERSK